jgi:hypothetical protein
MSKDARGERQRERQRRDDDVRQCVICRRWHTRPGWACSRTCQERLEGQAGRQ